MRHLGCSSTVRRAWEGACRREKWQLPLRTGWSPERIHFMLWRDIFDIFTNVPLFLNFPLFDQLKCKTRELIPILPPHPLKKFNCRIFFTFSVTKVTLNIWSTVSGSRSSDPVIFIFRSTTLYSDQIRKFKNFTQNGFFSTSPSIASQSFTFLVLLSSVSQQLANDSFLNHSAI